MKPASEEKHQCIRCAWARSELMIRYHDEEWGVPVHDDRRLFEFLILEGAQAGLSWETILNKRENYRAAFDGFDAERVAGYDRRKVAQLLRNPGIVRNRLKIASAVQNARAFFAGAGRMWQLRSLRMAVCRWSSESEFTKTLGIRFRLALRSRTR